MRTDDASEGGEFLHERRSSFKTGAAKKEMLRTQIYLSRAEYDFLQTEAKRRDAAMAVVIRSFIDEKMAVPDEAWSSNPLLQLPVDDPDYLHREDGAVNHDHYVSGGPKKYKKVGKQWKLQLPVK